MFQYKSFNIKMAIRKYSNKVTFLLNHLGKVIFLFIIIQFPFVLSAQVKIAQEKPKIEEPWWLEYKDMIYAPYDSSYLHIKCYPILDAYKKYIGQQLYLPSLYVEGCGGRGNALLLFCEDYATNHVWHPISTRGFYNNENDKKEVVNKYYTIIDILSLLDAQSKIHFQMECNTWKKNSVWLTKDISFRIEDKDKNIVPFLVLKETQSEDTVYTLVPESFILVGGFVKIQQKFIGRNIFEISERPSHDNINKNIIKEKWICKDVSLKVPPDGTFNNDLTVYLNLSNVNDSSNEKELEYNDVDVADNYGSFWSEIHLDTTLAKIKKDVKLREKEDVEFKRRLAQKKAAYKQELTTRFGATIAEKIILGKYEIGMSKSACKEIFGYATVIDKTATTETWRIVNIFGNSIYLYFNNDKLIRIVNI